MVSVENIRSDPSDKKITLDFGEQRRHSFLPDSWTEDKRDTTIKNVGVLEVAEDDDFFMFMHAPQAYEEKPMEKFCTGSKYLGQRNRLGIAGKGVYKYPHGVIYDGYFNRNGEFHGTGILVYPNGNRIEGIWKDGKLEADCTFVAKGGVVMSKNYCLMPDRRFQIELEKDFNPVGQEYLTNEPPPPRELPEGCYDLVEGCYDPSIKSVIDYMSEDLRPAMEVKSSKSLSTRFLFGGDEMRHTAFSEVRIKTQSEKNLETFMGRRAFDTKKVISWIPSTSQEEWIVKNCRRAFDESAGYRPDLYEDWTKGGRVYERCDMDEEDADSKCKLKTLNLQDEQVDSKRFKTFVRNEKGDKEAVTVDMLTKMFFKSSEISTNNEIGSGPSSTDIKMFSVSHQNFQSEDFLIPRKSN